MNEQELQQAFIQFLAQKTGAKTQQELETAIQQLGEEGLKQAYAEFMQLMQQQQVQAAKFGAKINYIKKLRGQCPDGYELQYYKSGGQLCKKCMKKQVMQEGGNLPQDPIDQFKCGRKIKKKKCEAGGTVNMDKCGAKMKKKKCESGGFIPFNQNGNTLERFQKGKPVRKPIKKQEEPEMFEIETSEEVSPAKPPIVLAPPPRQPEAPLPIEFPEIDENNEALQAKLQELNKSFNRDSTRFAHRFTDPNYRVNENEVYSLSRYPSYGRSNNFQDEQVVNEGNYDEIAKGNYAPENFRQIRYYINDNTGRTMTYGENGRPYPYTSVKTADTYYDDGKYNVSHRSYDAPVQYVLPIKKRR